MESGQIRFRLAKVTKGAIQYKEANPDDKYLIGTIYLRKIGMIKYLNVASGEWPELITVTVDA